MSNMMISLVATEARQAMVMGAPFKDRCRQAMKSAAGHWMVLDPDLQFRGALAAILTEYKEGSPEGDQVRREIKIMRALGAATSGVPVDFATVLEDVGEAQGEPIKLAEMWREIAK